MKKITAIINKKTGAIIKVETTGFNGAECIEATKALLVGLGDPDATITPTSEMYSEIQQSQETSQ